MTNSVKKAAQASVQAQAATKPPVAKPAAKRVAKPAAKAATKPVAKPAVQATAKPTTKAAAKPASKAAEKMDAPAVAAKPAKVKVVRDSGWYRGCRDEISLLPSGPRTLILESLESVRCKSTGHFLFFTDCSFHDLFVYMNM